MKTILWELQESLGRELGPIRPVFVRTRLRLERARSLLHDPGLTLEGIAARCGFESARQLRRAWKEAFGTPPSAARAGVT
jgi:transcriptional regulator GlxA family with amidase domain